MGEYRFFHGVHMLHSFRRCGQNFVCVCVCVGAQTWKRTPNKRERLWHSSQELSGDLFRGNDLVFGNGLMCLSNVYQIAFVSQNESKKWPKPFFFAPAVGSRTLFGLFSTYKTVIKLLNIFMVIFQKRKSDKKEAVSVCVCFVRS